MKLFRNANSHYTKDRGTDRIPGFGFSIECYPDSRNSQYVAYFDAAAEYCMSSLDKRGIDQYHSQSTTDIAWGGVAWRVHPFASQETPSVQGPATYNAIGPEVETPAMQLNYLNYVIKPRQCADTHARSLICSFDMPELPLLIKNRKAIE
ncbi:hypothetical protein NLJ89_g355 [Agrocybe chaxingu]|uniref:Uncharacterized protein n=1 Tax=Agrocybe chaxingu TaxID=84603 RepID=A0A9W8N213_9AGAR|nr:hypothetical protein NLJ89_g355 [Agrocybe chaxingu]